MVELVVDASLAAKWLVREQDSDLADDFLIQHLGALHAPDLFLVELGGLLVRRANQRLTDKAMALDGFSRLQHWTRTGIELHRVTPELAHSAIRLATDVGHPLKDCIYLALADQLGCSLATCDIKFRDRVADPARVRLLSELV